MKAEVYPELENVKLSEWQIKELATFFADNIGDIKNYIKEHKNDYIEYLNEEYQNGNISKKELETELKDL